MKKAQPVYRAKKSHEADMEFGMVSFVKGKTYTDDGTTILDAHVAGDDFFELAEREPDTVSLTHPYARS